MSNEFSLDNSSFMDALPKDIPSFQIGYIENVIPQGISEIENVAKGFLGEGNRKI